MPWRYSCGDFVFEVVTLIALLAKFGTSCYRMSCTSCAGESGGHHSFQHVQVGLHVTSSNRDAKYSFAVEVKKGRQYKL